MIKRSISLICLFALLIQCAALISCQKKLSKFTEYSFDYFDTVTTIVGYAEDQEQFHAVSADILAELGEYHKLFTIYHRFEGMENLCTVNELTNGEHRTVTVDRRIIDMLLYAKDVYTLTDGKVNVAMGSVLSIWHKYREHGTDAPWEAQLPPMEQLTEAAQHTDINNVLIDEEQCTVTLTDPKMTLDVGAVAKGYAVEMVAQSLEKKGITGYVLNVGGNVRTVGAKADGEPWKVGIESPEENEEQPYLANLYLADSALVTSGSYQRYYTVDNKRYHHIIDPATLMPSEGFVSVSVVCKSSADGDALSTALFCLTLAEGLALIESIEDAEALWVTADGTQHKSSNFDKYLAQ